MNPLLVILCEAWKNPSGFIGVCVAQHEVFRMRSIKSFVLRQGRMTDRQKIAIEKYWPVYGLESKNGPLRVEKIFQRSAPIFLEIGFGMGTSLAIMAQQHPENNYIGVEVHKPGVGSLLDLCHEAQLTNVRVFNEDVNSVLAEAIPDKALQGILIFFPDPWPKQKHRKRRLVQVEFVKKLLPKLQRGGFIHLATDWQDYAEHMQKVMVQIPELSEVAPGARPSTKFEQRGERLGHGIWDLMFTKL